jgi:hypothetical protein
LAVIWLPSLALSTASWMDATGGSGSMSRCRVWCCVGVCCARAAGIGRGATDGAGAGAWAGVGALAHRNLHTTTQLTSNPRVSDGVIVALTRPHSAGNSLPPSLCRRLRRRCLLLDLAARPPPQVPVGTVLCSTGDKQARRFLHPEQDTRAAGDREALLTSTATTHHSTKSANWM